MCNLTTKTLHFFTDYQTIVCLHSFATVEQNADSKRFALSRHAPQPPTDPANVDLLRQLDAMCVCVLGTNKATFILKW